MLDLLLRNEEELEGNVQVKASLGSSDYRILELRSQEK